MNIGETLEQVKENARREMRETVVRAISRGLIKPPPVYQSAPKSALERARERGGYFDSKWIELPPVNPNVFKGKYKKRVT